MLFLKDDFGDFGEANYLPISVLATHDGEW